jgi:hypothetical protein
VIGIYLSAAALLITGVVLGILAVVSLGIRREERDLSLTSDNHGSGGSRHQAPERPVYPRTGRDRADPPLPDQHLIGASDPERRPPMSTSLGRGPEGRSPRAAALPAEQPWAGQGARDAVFPAARGSLEGKPVGSQVIKPLPPELPGLRSCPRVLQLTDGDCVSHGLADGTGCGRASDQEVRSCLAKLVI